MSLLAYNKSGLQVTLTGTAAVLPASPTPPSQGPGVNVTAALTGLTGPQYAALEAQRLAVPLRYTWTGDAEFATGTLQVEEPQVEFEVANLAGLSTLQDTVLSGGTEVTVLTLEQEFELDKTSVLTVDGITVVATLSGTGRWLRQTEGSRKWAGQVTWWVDPVGGNDENTGAADASGQRLKTVAEVNRRLSFAQPGRNYQVNCVADVPSTDRFRPSFLRDQNDEDVNGVTGTEQIFNMTLNGKRTVVASSSLTGAGYTPSAGNVQATMVDAAFPGGIAAHIGDMIVLTSGANAGATAFIGKDLGAGVARVSDLVSPANVFVGAQVAGVTYDIVSFTKWNGSMIQIGDGQGRYQVNDFEFPAVAGAPADQENLAMRNIVLTFRTCRFKRPLAWDFGMGATAAACCFQYAALTIVGVVGGAFTYLGCCFIKADVQFISGVTFLQLNSNYVQDGVFQTRTNATIPTYGGTIGVTATTAPAGIIAINGNGLGVYDAPAGAGSFAVLLTDGARVRLGSGTIRGNASAESGLVIRSGSKLLVQDLLTPTILGTVNEVLLDGAAFACWTPALSGAGAIVVTDAAFNTWAEWTNAPTFNRHAFNPTTGSIITSVP